MNDRSGYSEIVTPCVSQLLTPLRATVYATGSCGTYGFLFFLPIILRGGLGYSMQMSFILTAPPAALAVIYALGISWAADRFRVRGPFILLHCALAIIGLCMIGFLDHPTPRYIGSFPGECGTNGLIVTGLAWGQNNVRGDAKRSVTTAIQVMMAAVGGIYSALVFRQQVGTLPQLNRMTTRRESLIEFLGCP